MPIIEITVTDKIAYASEDIYICGNNDYILKFIFDSEWDDLTGKKARVRYGNSYKDIPLINNQCSLPMMQGITQFYVGVYASDWHTSTPACIVAKKGITCNANLVHAGPNI